VSNMECQHLPVTVHSRNYVEEHPSVWYTRYSH
jgi:hypothetical protein